MINFTLSVNGKHENLRVPASETSIRKIQQNLGMLDYGNTRVYVDNVKSDISDLKKLEGTEQNMDFLNLLGRVIYGMSEDEYEKFRYGLWYEDAYELKDIINIALSTNRYSLIDETDLAKSGLAHEFDLRTGIPTSEVESTDYSIVAKKLLDSGKCEETPYGKKLYVNDEIPISDFFDGKHMPAYYDQKFVFAVTLNANGNKDCLFLPCADSEIKRSTIRLQCYEPDALKIDIEAYIFSNGQITEVFKNADIYTLNNFAMLVSGFDKEELDKFTAVYEYGSTYFKGLDNPQNVIEIANRLENFEYAKNVSDDYDLGIYLIQDSGKYEVDSDLEYYFNYESFGEDTRGNEAGRFFDKCYVGIKDYDAVKQFIHSDEMSMD